MLSSLSKSSASIYGKIKSRLLYCLIVIHFIIIILYFINTYKIKPILTNLESPIEFFMMNYFNDICAGSLISALSNLLFLNYNRYFDHFRFYFVLWVMECIFWEVLRPYILLFYNPFNKTPKFLWNDFIAYAIGTILIYLLICIIVRNRQNLFPNSIQSLHDKNFNYSKK